MSGPEGGQGKVQGLAFSAGLSVNWNTKLRTLEIKAHGQYQTGPNIKLPTKLGRYQDSVNVTLYSSASGNGQASTGQLGSGKAPGGNGKPSTSGSVSASGGASVNNVSTVSQSRVNGVLVETFPGLAAGGAYNHTGDRQYSPQDVNTYADGTPVLGEPYSPSHLPGYEAHLTDQGWVHDTVYVY